MIIANTVEEVRAQVKAWKKEGFTVGLVPTMGALHDGHASLIDTSAKQCNKTVASVFVNPTQFGENEDLDSYPRDFERDCQILTEHGCDMVFHPDVSVMYPEGFDAEIQIKSDMINQLCGASRPGHFAGVCTVVGKLFNIVAPDKAFFGEKDAQQLAVIRKMVSDLNFDLEVVGCPTIREEDGLAKSSRNTYLSEEERQAARVIHEAIVLAEENIKGGMHNADELKSIMKSHITGEPLAIVDYIEVVDGNSLLPIEQVKAGDLAAIAVYIGQTRLIDNFTVVM